MRRRPGVSAGSSSISWAGKHITRRLPAAAVIRSSPPPASYTPPAKVRHTVIAPQYPKWYRVLRGFKVDGLVNWEVIGEFPTQLEAMAHARTEEGHAIVNDWHSKVVFRNWQPIENREDGRQ